MGKGVTTPILAVLSSTEKERKSGDFQKSGTRQINMFPCSDWFCGNLRCSGTSACGCGFPTFWKKSKNLWFLKMPPQVWHGSTWKLPQKHALSDALWRKTKISFESIFFFPRAESIFFPTNHVMMWWWWCDDVMMWCCDDVMMWWCDDDDVVMMMMWWCDDVMLWWWLWWWLWWCDDVMIVLMWCCGAVMMWWCDGVKMWWCDVMWWCECCEWCDDLMMWWWLMWWCDDDIVMMWWLWWWLWWCCGDDDAMINYFVMWCVIMWSAMPW